MVHLLRVTLAGGTTLCVNNPIRVRTENDSHAHGGLSLLLGITVNKSAPGDTSGVWQLQSKPVTVRPHSSLNHICIIYVIDLLPSQSVSR